MCYINPKAVTNNCIFLHNMTYSIIRMYNNLEGFTCGSGVRSTVAVHAAFGASASLTDDLDHTLLHRRRIQAAVGGAPHYLIQQEMHEVLVGDEAPQIHLQVVAVHLDLLQPVAAERAQADTLEERLQADFDDARHHGDLGTASAPVSDAS